MTPISEIPTEMVAMAAGCVGGDSSRTLAVLLVAFEKRTEREAADRTGVDRSKIQRDRNRFREACEKFQDWRLAMKSA